MENFTYRREDIRFEGQAWYDGESGNEDEDAIYGGFYVSPNIVDPEPEKEKEDINNNDPYVPAAVENDPVTQAISDAYWEGVYAGSDSHRGPMRAPGGIHNYLFDADDIDYPERLIHDGPGLRDTGYRRPRYGEEGYDEEAEIAEVEAQRKIDEEKYANMKEKKRLRRQKYRANCKARGKTRKNSNWNTVKEILESGPDGPVDDNLDEVAAFLDGATAEEEQSSEDWESVPVAYVGEMNEEAHCQELIRQQEEAAAVPLPESEEEGSIPEEAKPDAIPENAPMSPPTTAADVYTNLRRIRGQFSEQFQKWIDDLPVDGSSPPNPPSAAQEKSKGKQSKQNLENSVALPKTADIARVSTARWADVTSGEEESDREDEATKLRFGEEQSTHSPRRMRPLSGGKLNGSGR